MGEPKLPDRIRRIIAHAKEEVREALKCPGNHADDPLADPCEVCGWMTTASPRPVRQITRKPKKGGRL